MRQIWKPASYRALSRIALTFGPRGGLTAGDSTTAPSPGIYRAGGIREDRARSLHIFAFGGRRLLPGTSGNPLAAERRRRESRSIAVDWIGAHFDRLPFSACAPPGQQRPQRPHLG